MSCNLIKVGVAAGLLALTACGGQAGSADSAPAGGPATIPYAQSSPSWATARQINESEFCPAVVAETAPALSALRRLVKHPDGDGLSVKEFSVPRDKLHARETQAPEHLRGYLHTEVGVLDEVIEQFDSHRPHSVKLAEFVDAKTEFVVGCEMAE